MLYTKNMLKYVVDVFEKQKYVDKKYVDVNINIYLSRHLQMSKYGYMSICQHGGVIGLSIYF